MKKGDLAFCSRGELGLVTSSKPVRVTYDDGSTGEAWTGIHLGRKKLGESWSSRTPIGIELNLFELLPESDLRDLFKELKEEA